VSDGGTVQACLMRDGLVLLDGLMFMRVAACLRTTGNACAAAERMHAHCRRRRVSTHGRTCKQQSRPLHHQPHTRVLSVAMQLHHCARARVPMQHRQRATSSTSFVALSNVAMCTCKQLSLCKPQYRQRATSFVALSNVAMCDTWTDVSCAFVVCTRPTRHRAPLLDLGPLKSTSWTS
jgi:hypothetical protein